MSERPDLRSLLRALDEQYAAVPPPADLEARLQARIRSEAPSPRAFSPREARRYARPMALAFAAGAALLILADAQTPSTAPEVVALEPNVPEAVLPEKIRADGGPSDPAPNAPPARRKQVISAPGLKPYPSWPDDQAPWPARPWLSPRSAPWTTRSTPRPAESPSGPFFDNGTGAEPWTPAEPRPEGPRRTLPAASSLMVAPPAQTLGAAPAPAAPQSHPQPSSPSPGRAPSAPPPSPTSAPAETPAPTGTEDCKSPDALMDEAASTCKSQGLALADVAYLDACGDGRFRRVEAKCNKDEPEACLKRKLAADNLSCQDASVFKEKAYAECHAAGLELVDLEYFGDGCPAGLSTVAACTCCPAPGAPPVSQCFDGQVGDAKTCQDAGLLKAQADDICRKEGLEFAGFKVSDDCQGGQSTVGFYVCCEKAP